jgi:hypothetical protein
MAKYVDASPPPSAHLTTLAQMGYSFATAVGDILDNSISAEASEVRIFFLKDIDDYNFRMVDNGCGMSSDELLSNMVVGCHDPNESRGPLDLGRFGSGLKTASFSQAEVLTVLTWNSPVSISGAVWDTNHVKRVNAWQLESLDSKDIQLRGDFSNYGFSETGTIVSWDGISCLEKDTIDEAVAAQVANIISELHDYIGLHFHRFLGSGLRVLINGTEVLPIDPFMRKFLGYLEGPEQVLRSKDGSVRIKAHTLPRPSALSEIQLKPYGGAKGITHNQGLYIYRNRRLIVAGGWHGVMGSSELGNLARIQVDIPSSMDWEWDTDVKKSRLRIPGKVRAVLRKVSPAVRKKSRKVHVYAGSASSFSNCWKVIENGRDSGSVTYLLDISAEQLKPIFNQLSQSDRESLKDFFRHASEELPVEHIYKSFAERPRQVQAADDVSDELRKLMEALDA